MSTGKWRVYNNHSHGFTHKEKFKGEDISIKAGDYVLMDYEDAVQFKGQYFPMKIDAQGAPDPLGFKMIKIEADDKMAKAELPSTWVSHRDGREFSSKAELMAYLKQFGDETYRDEALDEELAASVEKRKPGRPPKEKTL